MHRVTGRFAALALAVAVAGGCGRSVGTADSTPPLPTEWAAAVTNPLFPLVAGTSSTFEGQTASGVERTVVDVLATTRLVHGANATVVQDRVFLNGVLVEDTFDWYVQDRSGNVWYVGEDAKSYESGRLVSTEGSWEWGRDGATPGVIMWADPSARVGQMYRQEYLKGEAEDMGKVVAVNQSVTVPVGTMSGCMQSEDWNALEPAAAHEYKFYCPQVGLVAESSVSGSGRLVLVQRTRP